MSESTIPPLKRCTKCERALPATPEYFYKRPKYKDGLEYNCKECMGRRFTYQIAIPARDGYKICGVCKRELPATNECFYSNGSNVTGLGFRCKTCTCEYNRKRRKSNPDKEREMHRQYRQNNTNKENDRIRKWRQANPDKARMILDRYRQANPDKERERQRRWRRNNPDKYQAIQQRTRRRNAAKLLIVSQRRRARKRSLPNTFTHSQWLACLEWWNNCCAYCGKQRDFWHTIEMEHFIPLSSPNCPGTTALNIVPSCKSCNTSKNDNNAEKWLIRKHGKGKAAVILERIEAYFKSLRES